MHWRVVCLFVLASLSCGASPPDINSSDSLKKIRGNHYLTLAPALAWVHYKDEINSPLTYHTVGFPLGLEIGLENRTIAHSGYTRIFFSNQILNTDEAPFNSTPAESYFTFQLNTSRTWDIASFLHDRVHYALGYTAAINYHHQINNRLVNSSYTFAIWANAGVVNRFEFPFSIKTEKKWWFIRFNKPEQHLLLSYQLNIPLAGMITRPNFAGIRHFANGEFTVLDEMGNHLQFASLHNHIVLNSQLELWVPLGNDNKLKIGYEWQGFRYNQEFKQVQGVMGAVMVGLMFKLDGREEVR